MPVIDVAAFALICRRFKIARNDSGESPCAADFLLASSGDGHYGSLNPTNLCVVDKPIATDVAATNAFIAVGREDPDSRALGTRVAAPVALRRPDLAKEPR